MKTAMQKAIEKFEHALAWEVEGQKVEPYRWSTLSNDLYELLKEERQQIEDALLYGHAEATHTSPVIDLSFTDRYFTQTYEQ